MAVHSLSTKSPAFETGEGDGVAAGLGAGVATGEAEGDGVCANAAVALMRSMEIPFIIFFVRILWIEDYSPETGESIPGVPYRHRQGCLPVERPRVPGEVREE